MSRDDSDLAAMLDSSNKATAGIGRNGLKGRIRRAFSFSALKEDEITEEHDDDESIKASTFHSKRKAPATPDRPETPSGARTDDGESTVTVQTKKKSRAASLFNSRLNASTDNISLSSTVSSASVMIRKLGSMSKLVVRRNSLAGITSIFKDKNKETPDKQKKKDKKAAKSPTLQAEVSHVHAELDRVIGADANGLSPAAELARQHTLKTKAEAAAKAKAQQEAQVAVNGVADAGVPAWDKNTTTRAGSPVKHSGGVRVNEDGTRVVVEEEDDDSDDGHYDPHHNNSYNMDGWDDDEDEWDVPDTDEDLTIRIGMGKVSLEEHDDVEPWAMDARRSVERTRIPKRGILKSVYITTSFQPTSLTSFSQTPVHMTRQVSLVIHRRHAFVQTLAILTRAKQSLVRWLAYLLRILITLTASIDTTLTLQVIPTRHLRFPLSNLTLHRP